MSGSKKRLILTLGDPNGIGPEILLKIFKHRKKFEKFELKIAGSKKILDEYSSILNLPEINQNDIIEITSYPGFKLSPGRINKSAGKISGDSIVFAAELCRKKLFDGMITMPISKKALNLGGYDFPGHTEMLAHITKSKDVVMILCSGKFSVALITGHVALKKVSSRLKADMLFRKIAIVNNSLVRNFKIINPKIAVLALNPHSGDGGIIGNEELQIVIPVIEKMNSLGFNLRGPFSSDAYFANRTYEKFHMTIAMYHDQGLIPFKMISFGKGVNFTAGLNIIRTSPDHGTAFDIAGSGKANIDSTTEAIKLAGKLSGS